MGSGVTFQVWSPEEVPRAVLPGGTWWFLQKRRFGAVRSLRVFWTSRPPKSF